MKDKFEINDIVENDDYVVIVKDTFTTGMGNETFSGLVIDRKTGHVLSLKNHGQYTFDSNEFKRRTESFRIEPESIFYQGNIVISKLDGLVVLITDNKTHDGEFSGIVVREDEKDKRKKGYAFDGWQCGYFEQFNEGLMI